jgi:predicted component of type VI protein secretion system
MAFQLHISGPGLEVTRRIAQRDAPIVLGRDPDCDVCLPDPERTVSRRHLELWSTGSELHFHVVSTVNGIGMVSGEAPPGARGVIPKGEPLTVGDYVVDASELDPTTGAARDTDPWAALQRENSGASAAAAPPPAGDDPFSEWGFPTSFGAANPERSGLSPADFSEVSAFFRGLGLAPTAVDKAQLEALGRIVRVLALGVLDLHATVTGTKSELRPEDITLADRKDTNLLKSDSSPEAKLRYLFGGRGAAVGYIPAERAIREVLIDLLAHDAASTVAARAAVEGTLRDLSPAALKERLLGDGTKLFEGLRAWDAFCKWHDAQSERLEEWIQVQIDRHYAEAYRRESVRIRRGRKK